MVREEERPDAMLGRPRHAANSVYRKKAESCFMIAEKGKRQKVKCPVPPRQAQTRREKERPSARMLSSASSFVLRVMHQMQRTETPVPRRRQRAQPADAAMAGYAAFLAAPSQAGNIAPPQNAAIGLANRRAAGGMPRATAAFTARYIDGSNAPPAEMVYFSARRAEERRQ